MLRRNAPSQTGAANRPGFKPLVEFKKTPTADSDGKRKRKAQVVTMQPIDIDEFRSPYSKMSLSTIDYLAITSATEHEKMMTKLLYQPFQCPLPGYICGNTTRTLGMGKSTIKCSLYDPNDENALVLFRAPDYTTAEKLKMKAKDILVHVVVDPVLCAVLRPHQREGVKFMYDCVTGRKIPDLFGCIMADEMGLGKTLQCIALMWTLLKQSPNATPEINKAIIVCPSSLVKNWDKEINKWLGGRCNSQSIDSGKRDDIIEKLTKFVEYVGHRAPTPVIIISYETLRLYTDILHRKEIGLIICDEGHRLKNSENQTYQALNKLKCKRRVLISGTPIQNDLLEYYSLVNFVNPNMLGDASKFKRTYENPIIKGRDADATEGQQKLGEEKLAEMVALVNKCIIRRTSALLTKYLPVKYEFIVCCKNTELQDSLYKEMIKRNKDNITKNENAKKDGGEKVNGGVSGTTLSFITNLKKLCNHPQLIYEKCAQNEPGFQGCLNLFPSNFNNKSLDPSFSGKMMVLDYILSVTRKNTKDKFVLVSNYTQTMDAFAELCNIRKYPYVRLDGTLSIKQRGKIVEKFNNPESPEYCFLLSSKAGGCGLNLIGANRLVMFDPDWNPANDDQAMARVWRDGQKKTCFIYRLLSTGSIEEKMFQRQTHKKALSSCVVDSKNDVARHFSIGDLRTLFELKTNTASDTHEKLKCKRCINGIETKEPPPEADTSSDLALWFHTQKNPHKIPDNVLKRVFNCEKISFVFHQKSHEQTIEMKQKIKEEEEEEKDENYDPDKEDDLYESD